ncbi:MAG: hypothetical protein JWM27_737 [Gemmatimonadetes bacterium]|nr:hypothetical protein [Gemmatimonadota bacterium]
MYCSICGAHVPQGRSDCASCGERIAQRAVVEPSYGRPTHGVMNRGDEPVGTCPRCGYSGQGYGYFTRGANVGKLVGVTVITGTLLGVGGLAYYLMRKDHRICPACNFKWGPYGQRAVALAEHGGQPLAERGNAGGVSPWAERRRHRGSIALYVFAVMMMTVALANAEFVPFVFGAMAAVGGFFLQRSAETARETRREQLIAALQPDVLRLAAQRQGKLTVTEVASSLNWALPRAEKVLNSLDDGLRVRSDVTDEGVIVYEFPEVMFGASRLNGPGPGAATA